MRTTIELAEEHRAKLVELAARRGEKGFSRLIAEALDAYLRAVGDIEAKRRDARGLRGSLSQEDTAKLRAATEAIRRSWR